MGDARAGRGEEEVTRIVLMAGGYDGEMMVVSA